jgi:hypothetical protein
VINLCAHKRADIGFRDVEISESWDTFGGFAGEHNARAFDVYGYAFGARRG